MMINGAEHTYSQVVLILSKVANSETSGIISWLSDAFYFVSMICDAS